MDGGRKGAIGRFVEAETGALLVFFAMCCAAIFLIAALSFDLGKRASTQTELQSFADNVALAAAGELDGRPGAMTRAQRAAERLIRDQATFAAGDRVLAGAGDFQLTFFAGLPDDETLWFPPLDITLPESDASARFARVEVVPVAVPWSFARLLGVFSNDPLPPDTVAAEATAGFSAMACDVTPIFFCLPPADAARDSGAVWDPANHIGDVVKLVTAEGGRVNWGPGSMGFVYSRNLVDQTSYCDGLVNFDLRHCLSAVATRRTQCFENGNLRFRRGRGDAATGDYLNIRMDIFSDLVLPQNQALAHAAPPLSATGYGAGSTCGANGAPSDAAMALPPDDCFVSGGPGCTIHRGEARVGNGDWSQGRLAYVEANYSRDGETLGTLDAAERITVLGETYHIDDPFRPGDATHPRRADFETFPVIPNGASRWQYYNAEVAASYFEDPAAAYDLDGVDLLGTSALRAADPVNPAPPVVLTDGGFAYPISLLPDLERADGTTTPRPATHLPQCAASTVLDPRRRAFVAAAVDCDTYRVNNAADGRAAWFVELFMLDPVQEAADGSVSFHAEVISGGLQAEGASRVNGTFRNFAQLYR